MATNKYTLFSLLFYRYFIQNDGEQNQTNILHIAFIYFYLCVNIVSLMPLSPLNYLSVFTHSGTCTNTQTHSQMHYWRNELLSLPCCELCWVMSESRSPSDSRREGASHFLPFGVQLRAALHSFLLCFTSALLFVFLPTLIRIPPLLGVFQFYFHETQTWTHTHARRHGAPCRSFSPTKSHWSLSLLTQDDKVPFAADAQKGQGCRCIFAWGIE